MKKTITANFETVDMATLAVQRATSRCGSITRADIRYDSPHFDNNIDQVPALFDDFFPPYGSPAMPILNNGAFPETLMIAPLMDREQHGIQAMDRCKASVRITLEEKDLHGVSATLRQHGGYGLKVY